MADNGETVDNILFKPANPKALNLIAAEPERLAIDAKESVQTLEVILAQKDVPVKIQIRVLALGA